MGVVGECGWVRYVGEVGECGGLGMQMQITWVGKVGG